MGDSLYGQRKWDTLLEAGQAPFNKFFEMLPLMLLAPFVFKLFPQWLRFGAASIPSIDEHGKPSNTDPFGLALTFGAKIMYGIFVLVSNFPKISEARAASNRIAE